MMTDKQNLERISWLEIDTELQKAMCVTAELIGMLHHLHRDPQQSALIRAEIIGVARWVRFLIDQRQQTCTEVTEYPELVKLSARLVCDICRKGLKDNPERTSAQQDSAPSLVWTTQTEMLLTRATRLGMELVARDCTFNNLREFTNCFAILTSALLRLRRYLASIGTKEIKIEVEHSSHNCAVCGQTVDLETVI